MKEIMGCILLIGIMVYLLVKLMKEIYNHDYKRQDLETSPFFLFKIFRRVASKSYSERG